jgi:hypothetical protein
MHVYKLVRTVNKIGQRASRFPRKQDKKILNTKSVIYQAITMSTVKYINHLDHSFVINNPRTTTKIVLGGVTTQYDQKIVRDISLSNESFEAACVICSTCKY